LTPGATSSVFAVPTGFAFVQLATSAAGRVRIRASEIPGLAAVGSVQSTVSVDGFAEANTVLQEFPKTEGWEQRPDEVCRMRTQSMAEIVDSITALVGPSSTLSAVDRVQALVVLGQLRAYTGDLADTIRWFEQALPRARQDFADAVPQLEEMLGIAHLHRAAQENGVFARPGDRCLLSASPVAYADTRDVVKAADYFGRVLAARPGDGEATWRRARIRRACPRRTACLPRGSPPPTTSAGSWTWPRRPGWIRSPPRAAWWSTTSTTTARWRS
jgi:hypothetical protein